MTDKELRRLSRGELVEIIYELQKQLAASQSELHKAEQALSRRELTLRNAGSIAEAALGLNEVFAHAQAAADQYLAEVIRANSQAEEESKRIISEAQRIAKAIILNARKEGEQLLAQAKSEKDAMDRWMNL